MKEPKKLTAEDIRRLRRRLLVNQTKFGEILEYSHPQIRVSEIERGIRGVGEDKAKICRKLLKGLKVPIILPTAKMKKIRKIRNEKSLNAPQSVDFLCQVVETDGESL